MPAGGNPAREPLEPGAARSKSVPLGFGAGVPQARSRFLRPSCKEKQRRNVSAEWVLGRTKCRGFVLFPAFVFLL